MPLIDDVMQANPITQNGASQTVGDAIGAYGAVQKLQQDRQQFEMKKQENEMNKAQWLNSQIIAIGRQPEGAARNLMLQGFARQLPTIIPGANPDIPKLFEKDPEMLRKGVEAAKLFQDNRQFDPAALNSFFTQMTPEAIDTLNKNAADIAKIKAAQLGGQAMRAQTMQDNSTMAALDKFQKDPKLPALEDLGKKLDRDSIMLKQTDPSHPVTYQTAHEVLQNIATVLGNGTLSDARVNSISPHLGDEVNARIKTLLGNDPNQAADPRLIGYVSHIVDRLNNAVGADVVARARTIGNSKDNQFFHNPNIAAASKAKQQFYEAGKWRSDYSAPLAGGQPAYSSAPPAAEASQVATQGGGPSHWDHMSTADLFKEWTAAQAAKAKGGQ